MTWCRPGYRPLSEPIMVSLLTHICVTHPQWVNLPDTMKLNSSRTFTYKNSVGLVKLLCIMIFDINQIKPKSTLSPVNVDKFSWCVIFLVEKFWVTDHYQIFGAYIFLHIENVDGIIIIYAIKVLMCHSVYIRMIGENTSVFLFSLEIRSLKLSINSLSPSDKKCQSEKVGIKRSNIDLLSVGPFDTTLTHWGWDKMANILQMTFSNAFSWMKMYKFRFRFDQSGTKPNLVTKIWPPNLVTVCAWYQNW